MIVVSVNYGEIWDKLGGGGEKTLGSRLWIGPRKSNKLINKFLCIDVIV
jgi:hypothetical protein